MTTPAPTTRSPKTPAAADSATQVYRAKAVTGIVFGCIFVFTAALLFWLGFVLGPADHDAMSGKEYVLFSFVPIKPFCWIMSAAFLLFGIAMLVAAFQRRPTLVLSAAGLRIHDGEEIPYSQIESVTVAGKHKERLLLKLKPEANAGNNAASANAAPPKKRLAKLLKQDKNVLELNAFGLGTAPDKVKAEVEARMTER